MTEVEWISSTEPAAMLDAVGPTNGDHPDRSVYGQAPYRISDRKARLFACAVARVNGHDAGSVSAVEECVEAGQPNHNFSDREATDRGQFWRLYVSAAAARGAAHAYCGAGTAALLREIVANPWKPVALPAGPSVTCHICDGSGGELVATYGPPRLTHHCGVKMQERRDAGNCRDGYWPTWCPRCWWCQLPEHTGYRVDKPCTCCKGRKILPGRCPWLAHDDGAVRKLAEAAYQGRDWSILPLIADALETAGCEEESLLMHLRGEELCWGCLGRGRRPRWADSDADEDDYPCNICDQHGWIKLRGHHVRGCWATDVLTGRG